LHRLQTIFLQKQKLYFIHRTNWRQTILSRHSCYYRSYFCFAHMAFVCMVARSQLFFSALHTCCSYYFFFLNKPLNTERNWSNKVKKLDNIVKFNVYLYEIKHCTLPGKFQRTYQLFATQHCFILRMMQFKSRTSNTFFPSKSY